MPSLRRHHKQKECRHMDRPSHGNKNLCGLWCQSAIGNRNSKSINRQKTTAIHTLRIHFMQIPIPNRIIRPLAPPVIVAAICISQKQRYHCRYTHTAYSSSINLNISTWSCAIMQPVPEALNHWTARTICSIRLAAATSIRLFESLIRIRILMERVRRTRSTCWWWNWL